MNSVFLLRLVLDSVAAGLFLFAFAYFWQGNASHEWTGVGMFTLLILHNAFHRRWFASLAQEPRAKRGRFNIALTLVLLVGMLALLGTSMVISETLFADLRLDDDFTLRQVHAGIAYWLLIVVAIHLGLRWPLLMAVASKLFGFKGSNAVRTSILRVAAAGIALQGVFSALALNLPARLLFQLSLDWWNFEESVAAFFLHCMAIAGLCIFFMHYSMHWVRRRMRGDDG